MRRRFSARSFISAVILFSAAAPARAQNAGAYMDPGAASLVARARAFRDAADSTILSYTGTVRTRMAAGLRMPLKDRTLYRRESTARIRWSRNAPSVMKVVALREQTPAGVTTPGLDAALGGDEVFDPTQDRIYFGLTDRPSGDDEIWIEHPLVAGAEQHYRYQSGDTLTIRMQDGHTIRAIELRVIPRQTSGHLVTGSLWIDPSNGTVVQALYRLSRPMDVETEMLDEEDRRDFGKVPGMFKPMQFDITLVAIEYSLYDYKYWMPHVTRLEGYLRAGVIRTPASYEISYDIDDVVTATPALAALEAAVSDSVATAWTGNDYFLAAKSSSSKQGGKVQSMHMLMPYDSIALMKSPELPPPIWKANADFITGKELDDLYDRLERIAPNVQTAAMRPELTWGFGGSDLVRYNRVEALSVGARAQAQVQGYNFAATARLGLGDLHPNLELGVVRATTRRTVSLRARHALVEMDAQLDPFGMGNSTSALILGRDDGEYYRTTGALLTLAPPSTARANRELTFFAQHDGPVATGTRISLRSIWQSGFRFRENVEAASTELFGATLAFRPWWGSDPFRMQGGLDWMIEGASGGYEFARTRLTARTAIPIGSHYRVGLEAGAGTSEGDVPPQRLWYIGGAGTLRGYDGSTLSGTSFGRARAEVAKTFGWGALTIFGDAGWAGDRRNFVTKDILYSAGVGTSILDGLMRADLARALNAPKKWRLELYLDALL